MQPRDVKTREDFECLMKERAERFRKEKDIPIEEVPGFGATLRVCENGEPSDEEGRRVLCELNRMALSIDGAWVECGPVEEEMCGYYRRAMLYLPGLEWWGREKEDLEFILWMNIFKKRPSSVMNGWAHSSPVGSFCSTKEGCL